MSKNHFIGGIRPVVQRELREGARRPFNYWLRVGAGAAGLLLVVYVTQIQARNVAENMMGLFLFPRLHFLLMGLICLVVPCMTADCIAREKREGTLGLLFLTPLTAGGIVAGKGMAHGLRALTLWISMAPVLAIPFVMGGVGWAEASAAFALEFSTLVICLAAGLLASTLVKGWGAALLLALFLGGCLVAVFCWLACWVFLAQIPSNVNNWEEMKSLGGINILLSGLPLGTGDGPVLNLAPSLLVNYSWIIDRDLSSMGPKFLATANHHWHLTLWASPVAALLLFALVLHFAAWTIERSWRDKIPSARQQSLIRTYCTPLFHRWFARRTRRALDRNPIAWLQQYSWKARTAKLVLCLAFVLAATVFVRGNTHDYDKFGSTTAHWLVLIIAAGMTFAGINSFAEEKRSGALELILVTPLSVNQIIFGRVLGVWKQFLPAAVMLAFFDTARLWITGDLKFSWLLDSGGWNFLLDHLPERLLVVCGFITLPVIALYFTLRVRNSIVAAVLAWAALLVPFLSVLPLVGFILPYQLENYFDMDTYSRGIPFLRMSLEWVFVNLTLAVAAFFLLRRGLTRRLFPF
jgi:ABC-type Na+ efflux pump permease subunit